MGHAAPVWRRVLRIAGIAYVVVVLWFLLRQLQQDQDAARQAISEIGARGFAASFVFAAAGLVCTLGSWRQLLGGLGSRLSWRDSASVFFVAQAGKYVPGSVWPYAAQVALSGRYGVPAAQAVAVSGSFVLVHAGTGALVGVGLLAIVGAGAASFAWFLLIVPLAIVLLHPRVLGRLLGAWEKRRGVQPDQLSQPSWAGLLGGVAWLLVAWTAYGVSLWFLVDPLAADAPIAQMIGVFAMAWTVGFVFAAVTVFFAPAGLGAREAVLAALLTPLLPAGSVALVVVASRLVHTGADLLSAGVGLFWLRRRQAQ